MERQPFLQRIPLTVKMVFLTVMVGLFAGGVLDYFQTRTVKSLSLIHI